MPTLPAIPLSTYRLQLHAGFGFDAAAAIVPYLKKLGISHVYSSPFLKARSGSTHGYDIVDHRQLNPEFGGDEAFDRLSKTLADAGIGLILDFVPNHMGVGLGDNEWWLDVLEWGQKSPYAAFFDIDWSASPYGRKGAVLLPILGCAYGEALRNGEIRFVYNAESGSFSIWYYEHHLPIRPNRYGDILRTLVAAANASDEDAGKRLLELADRFPDPDAPSREEAPSFKRDIAAVPGGAKLIERGMSAYRTAPDDSTRLLALHRLLERQHYRLAWWRVSVSEINYRRFFDINDLAGIRVEDQRAFTAIHPLVIQLLEKGQLHGIRLDHIDGLYDPAQYARRLQRVTRAATKQPVYVVMEKILGDKEPCPRFAGMSGTTGYEWMNLIARVLIDAEGLPALESTWREESRRDRRCIEDSDSGKLSQQ
jgi:(1->4)-alpha-D-glucan 1-alpha-D-glucosylmutase